MPGEHGGAPPLGDQTLAGRHADNHLRRQPRVPRVSYLAPFVAEDLAEHVGDLDKVGPVILDLVDVVVAASPDARSTSASSRSAAVAGTSGLRAVRH